MIHLLSLIVEKGKTAVVDISTTADRIGGVEVCISGELLSLIIGGEGCGRPVEDFREYEPYNDGDKLIMLERGSIIELEDEIPFKGEPMLGFRYTTLERFMEAESTEELWIGK